jgi:hypothetical protein
MPALILAAALMAAALSGCAVGRDAAPIVLHPQAYN